MWRRHLDVRQHRHLSYAVVSDLESIKLRPLPELGDVTAMARNTITPIYVGPELVCVYQFKVVLHGISPMIWRRLLLRSNQSIADLYYAVQIAMGWTDSHLHRFHIHGNDYGVAHEGGGGLRSHGRQAGFPSRRQAAVPGYNRPARTPEQNRKLKNGNPR
jgi:hypothetical protein